MIIKDILKRKSWLLLHLNCYLKDKKQILPLLKSNRKFRKAFNSRKFACVYLLFVKRLFILLIVKSFRMNESVIVLVVFKICYLRQSWIKTSLCFQVWFQPSYKYWRIIDKLGGYHSLFRFYILDNPRLCLRSGESLK